MKALKILISAYACRPNMGSEPGVGWHLVKELAKHHQVWVLTRSENRPAIESELAQQPMPNLNFVYCAPPFVAAWLPPAHVPHYYFWQIGAFFAAKKLMQAVAIDLIHHVTYVRYSTPSFLALLPQPFIWGPVGGGEVAPKAFWPDFSFQAKLYEYLRTIAHQIGALDPFTRMTARRSLLARAPPQDTAHQLHAIGATAVEVYSESGLSAEEIQQLSECPPPPDTSIRFISMARLLHWKGLHLSIQAFATARLPDSAEYWILGEGPEKANLQNLAQKLGVGDRVKFLGRLPRPETLRHLSQCHVLVHASLHDSGGWVCLEAMATGRPVICLDLGGPSIQVTDQTGVKVPAHTLDQTVDGLSNAMTRLAADANLRTQMGQAGQQRVQEQFSWEVKGRALTQLYTKICRNPQSCAF